VISIQSTILGFASAFLTLLGARRSNPAFTFARILSLARVDFARAFALAFAAVRSHALHMSRLILLRVFSEHWLRSEEHADRGRKERAGYPDFVHRRASLSGR